MTFPARCLQSVTVAKAFIAYGYPGLPRERLGGSTPPIAIDLTGIGHPTVNSSKKFKAFHAAEVPYVFGRFDMFGIEATEEDYVFSNTMMDMWTNFAKTGNPSIKDSITWPEYESSNQVYMLMGESISIDKNLRSKKVSLINEAYDKAREEF